MLAHPSWAIQVREAKLRVLLLMYKVPWSCPQIISQDFKERLMFQMRSNYTLGFQLSKWQLRCLIGSAILGWCPEAFYIIPLPSYL